MRLAIRQRGRCSNDDHPSQASDPAPCDEALPFRAVREAAEYYRERAGNPLSQALFEDFERSISVLLNNPELGAARRYGKRHYDLKRFPYSVVFTISGQEVRVLAVAHQSRRPGYWRRRK